MLCLVCSAYGQFCVFCYCWFCWFRLLKLSGIPGICTFVNPMPGGGGGWGWVDASGCWGLRWYMHPKPEIAQNTPTLDPKLQAMHRAFCAAISTPSSPTRADSRIGRALEARVGAVCCCFVFDRAFFFHCVRVQSSGVCLLFLGLVLSGVKVWGSKSRRFPVRKTANLKP